MQAPVLTLLAHSPDQLGLQRPGESPSTISQARSSGLAWPSTGVRAVLWSDNQVVNLNTPTWSRDRSRLMSCWKQAVDINDSGWILVSGLRHTGRHQLARICCEPVWP